MTAEAVWLVDFMTRDRSNRNRNSEASGGNPSSAGDPAFDVRRPSLPDQDLSWYSATLAARSPRSSTLYNSNGGAEKQVTGVMPVKATSTLLSNSPISHDHTKGSWSSEFGRLWFMGRRALMIGVGTTACAALTAAAFLQPTSALFAAQVVGWAILLTWNYQFLILKPYKRPETTTASGEKASLGARLIEKAKAVWSPHQRAWNGHFLAQAAICGFGVWIGGGLLPLGIAMAETYISFRRNSTFVPVSILRDVLHRAESYYEALERAQSKGAVTDPLGPDDMTKTLGRSLGDIDYIGGSEYMDRVSPRHRKY